MKRILYIHHAGGIGGAPLSLLYLLQQLDRERYEPVVLTLQDGPVVEMYRAEGIETHVAEAATDFSHTNLEWYGGRDLWRLPGKLLMLPVTIRSLRRYIRTIAPDIVHLNSSTLAAGVIAARREGKPVVWHIREPLHSGYIGLRRAWLRRVARQHADRIVAISRYDAEQIMPGGDDRVHVVHNFVHFEDFDRRIDGQPIREELGISHNQPMITMLGGVAEPKGTLPFIHALPHVFEQCSEARIVIAGPAPRPLDEGGVKGLIKKVLGVDAYQKAVMLALDALPDHVRQAVTFTGIRRDMPHVIAASDVVVFPSVVAHFARPVIEAAAMATPAVASDLGGPQELIVHGETGLLVPPADPPALAEALLTILQSDSTDMGQAAYERACLMFDALTNTDATMRVYDNLQGG